MNIKRAIRGVNILLDEASKALEKNDMERCHSMLEDADDMLSNVMRELSNGKEKNKKESNQEKSC